MYSTHVNIFLTTEVKLVFKDASEHVFLFSQGCARFPEFLQNFSDRQIFWSLCLVVFLHLTIKYSIST